MSFPFLPRRLHIINIAQIKRFLWHRMAWKFHLAICFCVVLIRFVTVDKFVITGGHHSAHEKYVDLDLLWVTTTMPSGNKKQNNVTLLTTLPTSTFQSDFLTVQPRTWEPYPATQQLCFEPRKLQSHSWKNGTFPLQSQPFNVSFMTTRGIVFLKPMKVGGSTASGVNIRLAKNMAQRLEKDYPLCENNFDHAMGWMMQRRKRSDSFLWTLLRDPTERAISGFFHFDVSRFQKAATLDNFVNNLQDQTNYYLRVHSFRAFRGTNQDDNMREIANEIIQNYDYMAITERFDESMVVLQMLLQSHNVTLGDVLYVRAKTNGGYDDGGYQGRCTYIQKSNLTASMKAYVSSDEWKERVKWDQALYQAANRSLDMTIDKLGRNVVKRQVETYRLAQELVRKRCAAKAKLPCTPEGVKRKPKETNCLFSDSGCAYQCMDELVSAEFNDDSSQH